MAWLPRPSSRGFALIELMIAMGISALIVGGMALALQAQERAYGAQGAAKDERRNLEAALAQLQQDLQLAGAALPPRTLPAIDPGPGNGRPVLTIRYLTDAPFVTTLTADASQEAKGFRISPEVVGRFQRGDQVLITYDGAWLAFWAGNVGSRIGPNLELQPEMGRRMSDESIRFVFPPGSQVVRLRDAEVQYFLAQGENGDRLLVRRYGGREAVVAAGIRDLSVEYMVASVEDADLARPLWTSQPPVGTPILGARVHLAVGRTSVRFTVTPRNLLPSSPL